MPRFSIKDLLLSMTLVAIGFAMLLVVSKLRPPVPDFASMVALLAAAFAIIGAGLFAPFHRKLIGAIIGGALAMALVAILTLTTPTINSGPRPLPLGVKFKGSNQAVHQTKAPPEQTH